MWCTLPAYFCKYSDRVTVISSPTLFTVLKSELACRPHFLCFMWPWQPLFSCMPCFAYRSLLASFAWLAGLKLEQEGCTTCVKLLCSLLSGILTTPQGIPILRWGLSLSCITFVIVWFTTQAVLLRSWRSGMSPAKRRWEPESLHLECIFVE